MMHGKLIHLDSVYREWCRTGVLPSDDYVVECLFEWFIEIHELVRKVPEYQLTADHAYKTAMVLRDILNARGIRVNLGGSR